jgi:hypothetical protein
VFSGFAETAARLVRGALAASATALVRAVVIAGATLSISLPLAAQDLPLQASLDGRLYVLVNAETGWTVLEPGGEAVRVPADRTARFDSLQAIDAGWILAGDRARRDGRRELALFRGGDDGVASLPVPPAGESTVRNLEPLVEHGKLVGIAWLEGDDPGALGVRAAAWSNGGFQPADWVSPPAGRSQLALSGAVMDNGQWILVWSSFDGTDDEILWSRRDGSSWTPPARLNAANRVPDITPVVTATAGGALCAWAQYDQGDYRVHTARLRGGAWSAEQRVGEAGSVFPFFVVEGEGRSPYLVYRDGADASWRLLALDRSGAATARSRFEGPASERPLVRRGAHGSMTLEWLRAAPAEARGGR